MGVERPHLLPLAQGNPFGRDPFFWEGGDDQS